MMVLHAVLLATTLLCSLVAGFLFAFAAVVMPGLRRLEDGAFIRTFQVIDRVIQNNQPLFIFVWVGSALGAIAVAALGMWALTGIERLLSIAGALVYLAGVQLPTLVVNVPMNNELQRIDVPTMTDAMRHQARAAFEARWTRWNAIRTVGAVLATVPLLLLVHRL
jgi:uncharacterized membrane protein